MKLLLIHNAPNAVPNGWFPVMLSTAIAKQVTPTAFARGALP
jgi:hypothetical protein